MGKRKDEELKLLNEMADRRDTSYEERSALNSAIYAYEPTPISAQIVQYTLAGFATIIVGGVLMFGFGYITRTYNVWAMEMEGKAKLAEASQSRQIQIEQAKGEKEAATFTAEAIAIVGKAAKAFPEYRNQTFIQSFGDALNNGNIQKVIFVPTEANIPLLQNTKGE